MLQMTWPSLSFLCTSIGHSAWTENKFITFSPTVLLWWSLLDVLSFSQSLHSVPYKVGVVGPWACDPLFSKALPNVAAKLAIERINKDLSFDLGLWFNYVILEEDCQTSKALSSFLTYYGVASGFVGPTNPGYCDAATLLGKNWNKAMFSWACTNYELDNVKRYPTFARTLPSPTRVLFNVMRYFQWAHVGVVSSNEDLWRDTGRKVASALRNKGLPIGIVISLAEDTKSTRTALEKIRKVDNLRVIIMCMHSVLIGGQEQKHLLEVAHDLKMTDGSYVFVPYDTLHYSLPYEQTKHEVLEMNSKLRAAYDAVLTITVESEEMTFYQAFQKAKDSGELTTRLNPSQVSPLFGTIYNAIYFIAQAVNSSRSQGTWVSGTSLVQHSTNMEFYGFNQRIRTDSDGNGFTNFVILDTDTETHELHCSHVVDMETDTVRYMGRPIHFPNGVSPKTDSYCWFANGKICTGGIDPAFAVMGFVCVLAAILSINGFICVIRRCVNKIKLVKGPKKILLTLEDVMFINPQFSSKMAKKVLLHPESGGKLDRSSGGRYRGKHPPGIQDKVRQIPAEPERTQKHSTAGSLMSESGQFPSESRSTKSPRRSCSVKSLPPATYENSNVAVYEGDWVWMKKFPCGDFGQIKPGTSDVFEVMKDLRHENVNPFLGFFRDCGVFAFVTEFCSRGSLKDLLCEQGLKLDWMFKSSLLLDLIKGMKYLHNRKFIHGRLKSANCVVDGRFVLKVTDYGYSEVLETQKISHGQPLAQELLWTAPELLRVPRGTLQGSFPGDVYSFSIIMQEVVVHGPPFSMLEYSAQEIIQKIKQPSPVCRPLVSPDHAPMECILLMERCWNEVPDQRPTFDEIFNQFKNINKGKKTNIIDSMLRMLEQYSSNLEDLIRERTEELEMEKQKTEQLLTQMLPPSVAEALKTGCTVEPESFDQVTLYFSDIVGFTTISAMSEPIEVVDLLNDLYTLFDAVIGDHDVYKVETIGDAYMVASGLPKRNGNRHAAEIANMSLDILSAVGSFKMRHMPDIPIRIRIGLHSGPVVAGVVGLTMPRYCLFGDTVNTASRMESTGLPYRIHVSKSTVQTLSSLNEFYLLEPRGRTELKGKGFEETYWLVGKEGFAKLLPVPPTIKSGLGHGLLQNEIKAFERRKAERELARKSNGGRN